MNQSLVERYRPKCLKDLILDEKTRIMIESFLQKNDICNILLYGAPGIGKTTLAKIIVRELGCYSFLYINASLDNNVDMIRTQVRDFVSTLSIDGKLKIVILDECDAITGPAQAALRNLIEDSASDTRFILTCNYLDKIIAPIQSRCTPIRISHEVTDVIKRILYIIKKEKVKIDKEVFKTFVDQIIRNKYPDIRLIINILEQCIQNGQLIINYKDNKGIYEEIFEKINEDKFNLKEFRQFVLDNENLFSKDYINLSQYIFNKTDDPNKMVIIADHIFRMSQVIDKEIEFIACIINLKNLNKEKI